MDPQPPPWRILEASAAGQLGTTVDPDLGGAPANGTAAHGASLQLMAALGLAAVLALAAGAMAISGLSGATVDAPGSAGASAEASDVAAFGSLVVDVAGAVVRPGVYRLAPGSRIADALAAAGGFAPRVDAGRVAAALNLAALIRDGDRIVVPSRDDAPATSGGGPGATAGLVDLNRASAEELDTLPGIGPVTAAKILASRTDQPFHSVNDLLDRKLVGAKTFDKLKPLVTVG